MVAEKRELRSWRDRIGAPLKGAGQEIREEAQSTNQTNPQTPDSIRVGKWTQESTNHPQTSEDRPRLVRTGPTTWEEAEWSRKLCVFCEAPAVDVIACAEHRAKLDQLVMPWER